MVKGLTHYLRQAWKKPDRKTLQERMIEWRKSLAVEKVEKPLRLDRARALGYKAKKGFVILRVRVKRGGRKREREGVKGRKTRKQTNRKTLKMNYQWVAEIRAARKYPSLEVLNSYNIGKDGKHYFYEVIMVDPSKQEIKTSRTTNWITKPGNKKRAERGLTSAAKKSRGLKSKRGKSPTLKVRPSLRAHNRKGK
ncbi:MAG: 50S ribosomal protein L15e [Nanoarchaeota archaeon]|nr:50S ribosomal protein L15e [Nanoarchaeota archaeon]